MNRAIDIKRRQSLLDITVQQTGSMDGIFEIAEHNELSISETLTAGESISVNKLTNKTIADYFRVNKVRPATSVTLEELNGILGKLEGIDYWIVEEDFIVT